MSRRLYNPRNSIVRDLHSPKYRQRVIPDKRAYAASEADAQAAFEAFCEAEQSEWDRAVATNMRRDFK